MKRICVALLCAALFTVGGAPAQPVAATSDPTADLVSLDRQLSDQQAQLEKLNAGIEHENAELDRMNRQLAADQARLDQLRQQASLLARLEYERPALTLEWLPNVTNLGELLTDLNQTRLLAEREQTLATQARQLHRQDDAVRAQQSVKVAEVTSARDQAAELVTQTQVLRDQAADAAAKARAETLAAQARATQAAARPPPVPAPVSVGARVAGAIVEAPGGNHFAYGYCTWYVANRRNIPWFGNAIEWWPNARAYGYAEGQAPAVGAVMVTRESSVGHVAYVESVNGDGSWTVSEMNFAGWNIVTSRTLRPGQTSVLGFIYGKG